VVKFIRGGEERALKSSIAVHLVEPKNVLKSGATVEFEASDKMAG
jgi:hypothetical protein